MITNSVMGLAEGFTVLLVALSDPVITVGSHLLQEEDHHPISRGGVTLTTGLPANTVGDIQNHQGEKVGISHLVHPLLIPIIIKQPVAGQEILQVPHSPVSDVVLLATAPKIACIMGIGMGIPVQFVEKCTKLLCTDKEVLLFSEVVVLIGLIITRV